MNWVRLVMCPVCEEIKEVGVTQKNWKCPDCKRKWSVASTLWKAVKKGGDDNG